jgi:protein SCO1/2
LRRLLAVAALLAAFAGSVAAAPTQQAVTPPLHGVDISHAKTYAQAFRLTDHEGRVRQLADFRGKAVVLFFGYLQCPNFCPVTLLRYAQTMELLGEDAKRVQVLFVTLDPERDVPAALKEYVTAFHPSFLGLYDRPETTPDLALRFRVYYKKVPGQTPGNYHIDHAVFSYAYDPAGKLRLLLRDTLTAEQVAEDLRQLLR